MILISLLTVVVLLFVITGFFAFKKEETILDTVTDAIKFKTEYESLNGKINDKTNDVYPSVQISDTNKFVYKNEEEILKILESESGVIYFGFKSSLGCRRIIKALDRASQNKNIEAIYYVDIENIRDVLALDENNKIVTEKEGNSNYYKLLKILDDYLADYLLKSDEDTSINTGEKRLYAPTVVAVLNGDIVDFYESNEEDTIDDLSKEEENKLVATYENLIEKTLTGLCDGGC